MAVTLIYCINDAAINGFFERSIEGNDLSKLVMINSRFSLSDKHTTEILGNRCIAVQQIDTLHVERGRTHKR